MPPAPPDRPDAAAFHYHTYEYPGDAAARPFQPSGGLPSAGGKQFYSLVEDLNGLEAWGNKLGTPRALLDADATGTVMDHAAQRHQSRAFTIELDPASDAIDAWMLPEERICTVFEKNVRGALAALAAATLPNMTTGHLRYVQFVQLFSTWNVYGRGNQLPA
jgi:hypothetical protein